MAEKIQLLKEEPPKDKDKDSKRPTPIQIAPRGQSLWKECKFWGNNIAVRSYGSASVAGDKLYVFGGQQLLGGVLDDFYSVQLNIDAEHTPGYEWKKEPTANGPGKRARHVALVQGTNIYFHGGIKPGFVTTSDFFMFDTKGSTWTMIKSADSPCLDSHSGVVFGDKMFYFCGLDGKQQSLSNSVYCYDLAKSTWEKVKVEAKDAPCPRSNSAVASDGKSMFLFAGKGQDCRLNDLWLFHKQAETWAWKSIEVKEKPLARNGHSLNYYQNQLVLFGGIHELTWQLDDLQVFLLDQQKWKPLQVTSARRFDSENSPHRRTGQSPYRSKQISPTKKLRLTNVSPEVQSPGRMLEEQRKKKFLQRKAELLKQFQVNGEQAIKLIQVEPVSQAMKDSLDMLHGVKASPMATSHLRSQLATTMESKFCQPLGKTFAEQNGKRPCARDGHSVDIWGKTLVIFGGDRHQMSFDDLHKLNLEAL